MIALTIVKCIFSLLGGLGVFMFGMRSLSIILTNSGNTKIKSLMTKMTNKGIRGITTGALITASIQSSSAMTVMIVGFVNSGFMSLLQATYLIMGANIGTTLTGFIISLESLPITQFLTTLTAIGVFGKMLCNKEKPKQIFEVLTALGMIFMGLFVMSNSTNSFAKIHEVKNLFLATTNPALLFMISMLATGIIQSSTAGTGIVMGFASSGLMSLESALYCVLGMNVGTCITALIASIGTSINGKRTALIHLLFNLIGTLEFFLLLLIPPIKAFIFSLLPTKAIALSIAIFNLIFNVISTITVAPFAKGFVRLVEIFTPENKKKAKKKDLLPKFSNKKNKPL